MMDMKQIAMIRHPRELVWTTVRDCLPELVADLDDIQSVVTTSRSEDQNGVVTVESAWRACPNLPALIADYVNTDMLAWTDHAQWFADRFETQWVLTPQVLADRLRCTGTTRYMEAMGGRGTRVAFEVSADVLPGVATPQFDETSPLFQAVQSAVVTLVCKNFRRLIDNVNEVILRGTNRESLSG